MLVTGTATGSGTDYTLANGTLTINAGNTTGTITIASIVNDSLDEANETVIVTLSNPSNATLGSDSVHTYTITDNDNAPVVDFNSTSSNGAESVSSKALTVDLSAASGQNVTVDYAVTGTATGSGTDYTLANGTLTISAGQHLALLPLLVLSMILWMKLMRQLLLLYLVQVMQLLEVTMFILTPLLTMTVLQ